ncbi:hypothetical protein DMENIID0001_084490 [Sergentomyia squamirostris]
MSDVSESELTFVKSRKGADQLVHNGYIFQHEKERNGKRIWRCILYSKANCRGRVHTVGATVKEIKVHNHEPDEDEIIVRRCLGEITERAKAGPDYARNIVLHGIRYVTKNSCYEKLPTWEQLIDHVERVQQRQGFKIMRIPPLSRERLACSPGYDNKYF